VVILLSSNIPDKSVTLEISQPLKSLLKLEPKKASEASVTLDTSQLEISILLLKSLNIAEMSSILLVSQFGIVPKPSAIEFTPLNIPDKLVAELKSGVSRARIKILGIPAKAFSILLHWVVPH